MNVSHWDECPMAIESGKHFWSRVDDSGNVTCLFCKAVRPSARQQVQSSIEQAYIDAGSACIVCGHVFDDACPKIENDQVCRGCDSDREREQSWEK